MGKPTSKITESFGYTVYLVNRRFRKDFIRIAADANIDITPEQWFSLNKLRHSPPLTQSDLLDDGFNDRPNITRLITHMEAKGWLVRENDAKDARKHRVSLTRKGKRIHDSFEDVLTPIREKIYANIDPEKLAIATEVLAQVDRNLRVLSVVDE